MLLDNHFTIEFSLELNASVLKNTADLKAALKSKERELAHDYFCGYPVIPLEILDLSLVSELKTAVDENGACRSVYYDEKNNLFIKIWSEDYQELHNFYAAVKCHFYDGLAPLIGVIFDRGGKCRGYVTYGLHQELDLKTHCNQHGFGCLEKAGKQNMGYQRFYKKLLDRCLTTGFFYIDLVPSNLKRVGKEYWIIDLEPVLQLQELKSLQAVSPSKWDFLMEHLPSDYAQIIQSITNQN